jgi:hypothetical protein
VVVGAAAAAKEAEAKPTVATTMRGMMKLRMGNSRSGWLIAGP